jgi:archaellum component FlaC
MESEHETQLKILSLVDTISVQVGKTHAELVGFRGEVSGLRGEVSDLRGDVSDLRREVSELRLDVTGIRSEMRTGFDRLERRIEPLER